MSIYHTPHLSVCLPVCPFVSLPIYPSVCASLVTFCCLSLHLSIPLFCLPISTYVHLFTHTISFFRFSVCTKLYVRATLARWSILCKAELKMDGQTICLYAGNPYWRGKLSTVDLLLLSSLHQLLLTLQTFFTKQANLLRSTILLLHLHLLFLAPMQSNQYNTGIWFLLDQSA